MSYDTFDTNTLYHTLLYNARINCILYTVAVAYKTQFETSTNNNNFY